MIDLHTHTNYSDGSDTTEQLLKKAEKVPLEILSITDHNTCEAYKDVKNYQGKIITGCEFTTTFNGRLIEVLGYNFELNKINKFLNKHYNNKEITSYKIRDKIFNVLDKNGIIYNKKEILATKIKADFIESNIYFNVIKYKENYDKVENNMLKMLSNFFREGLTNPNSLLYVDYTEFYPSIEKIICEVHNAGGLVFLAHPFQYKINNIEEFLDEIFSTELDGLEAHYTKFTKEQTNFLLDYAKKNNLLISGGSDYHGKNKTNHNIGTGNNNLEIDKSILKDWNIDI